MNSNHASQDSHQHASRAAPFVSSHTITTTMTDDPIETYWHSFYNEILMKEPRRQYLVAVLNHDGLVFIASELADRLSDIRDEEYPVENVTSSGILHALAEFGLIVPVPKIHRDDQNSWLIVTDVRDWLNTHDIDVGQYDYPRDYQPPEFKRAKSIIEFIGRNREQVDTLDPRTAVMYGTIAQYAEVENPAVAASEGANDQITIGPYEPDDDVWQHLYYDYEIEVEFAVEDFLDEVLDPERELKNRLHGLLMTFYLASLYGRIPKNTTLQKDIADIAEEFETSIDIQPQEEGYTISISSHCRI